MSLGWKLGLWGLALVAVATTITLAYRHYEGLLEQVSSLTGEKAKLETTLASKEATISTLKDRVGEWDSAYKKLEQAQAALNRSHQEALDEVNRINELLAKHDFGVLARRKPGLVERRVNGATARALRLLECASDPAGRGCAAEPAAPADQPEPAAAGPDSPAAGGVDRGHP